MKILCGKRDEILKDKKAYDDFRAKYDEQLESFYKAQTDVFNNLRNIIIKEIGNTSLNLDIKVDSGYNYDNYLRVNIRDENDRNNPNKALNWSWEVQLSENGDVKKDSSSWSGLKAVTPENVQNLKDILDVIIKLNDIDWNAVLNIELPKYTDYVKDDVNPYADRNFNQELFEVSIEETIGQPIGILGHGNKYYNPRSECVYKIVKDSGSQYTVVEMLRRELQLDNPTYRISKSKFLELIDSPLQTIDLGGIE